MPSPIPSRSRDGDRMTSNRTLSHEKKEDRGEGESKVNNSYHKTGSASTHKESKRSKSTEKMKNGMKLKSSADRKSRSASPHIPTSVVATPASSLPVSNSPLSSLPSLLSSLPRHALYMSQVSIGAVGRGARNAVRILSRTLRPLPPPSAVQSATSTPPADSVHTSDKDVTDMDTLDAMPHESNATQSKGWMVLPCLRFCPCLRPPIDPGGVAYRALHPHDSLHPAPAPPPASEELDASTIELVSREEAARRRADGRMSEDGTTGSTITLSPLPPLAPLPQRNAHSSSSSITLRLDPPAHDTLSHRSTMTPSHPSQQRDLSSSRTTLDDSPSSFDPLASTHDFVPPDANADLNSFYGDVSPDASDDLLSESDDDDDTDLLLQHEKHHSTASDANRFSSISATSPSISLSRSLQRSLEETPAERRLREARRKEARRKRRQEEERMERERARREEERRRQMKMRERIERKANVARRPAAAQPPVVPVTSASVTASSASTSTSDSTRSISSTPPSPVPSASSSSSSQNSSAASLKPSTHDDDGGTRVSTVHASKCASPSPSSSSPSSSDRHSLALTTTKAKPSSVKKHANATVADPHTTQLQPPSLSAHPTSHLSPELSDAEAEAMALAAEVSSSPTNLDEIDEDALMAELEQLSD